MRAAVPPRLTRYAWLSIAAALVTMGLKSLAWWFTGSVGLLSDAAESLVNLLAATVTLTMLTIAARPPDSGHEWGHTKAEYFSSGFEGALIMVAALAIGWAAIDRLLALRPLEQTGFGLAVSTVASLVNLGVARVLLRAGRRYQSIALEADGRHLLTDVWTSVGVLLGIGLVVATGWLWVDPVLALLVAANIVWSGVRLLRRSMLGLLDSTIAPEEKRALQEVLARFSSPQLRFHAVRTRQAASRRFITMHVLVPGDWSVRRGHLLLEVIEQAVRDAIPNAHVVTHLEPVDDPVSFADEGLDRSPAEGPPP